MHQSENERTANLSRRQHDRWLRERGVVRSFDEALYDIVDVTRSLVALRRYCTSVGTRQSATRDEPLVDVVCIEVELLPRLPQHRAGVLVRGYE